MEQEKFLNEVVQSARVGGSVGFNVTQKTAYADLLQVICQNTITNLVARDAALENNLQSAFIAGDVALGCAVPYRVTVADHQLPEKTALLWRLIYTWLFVFAAKRVEQIAKTRFLQADLSSKVDITLWLYDHANGDGGEFKKKFEDEFQAQSGFVPEINIVCKAVSYQELAVLLSEICIYGSEKIDSILMREFGDTKNLSHHRAFADAVNFIDENYTTICQPPEPEEDDQVVSLYRQISNLPDTSICLDWLPKEVKLGSTLYQRNDEFFSHILSGRYDVIHVEDITKSLGDKRNLEKENRFTLVKVNGLECNSRFVPAVNVVMKLRGFSYFRGDLNNWLDLLKEYMNYVVLSGKLKTPRDYLLQIGPLMLTCEKLDLPLDLREKQRLLGIFLEEITSEQSHKIVSCRVKYLTDFWGLDRVIYQINRVTQDTTLKKLSLRKEIRNLARDLLENQLRIDYCDISILLDQNDKIIATKLFDFERTSFQELVSEQHIILDTFIDLKRLLRKEYWEDILLRAFHPLDDGGIADFFDIKKYLRPKNKKRELMYALLWRTQDVLLLLGESLGNKLWRIVFPIIAELSSGLFSVTKKYYRR